MCRATSEFATLLRMGLSCAWVPIVDVQALPRLQVVYANPFKSFQIAGHGSNSNNLARRMH
jgi:hypothetical protein